MNVTDDRQTDRQTTDGRATANSEREPEFTCAKNLQVELENVSFQPVNSHWLLSMLPTVPGSRVTQKQKVIIWSS